MDKNRQATDIDRKLAIYYHPLFQQVIKNVLHLFQIPTSDSFQIGLIEFLEFNLKLQKSLLPTFQTENALVSALNDWVKQVAECLTYEGMVSTSKCQEITSSNFSHLLEKQLDNINIELFSDREEYMKTMTKMATHDAFKLLGVKINKEVFNKFIFDLCSTWCQFLDIQLFTYFIVAIYIQISTGPSLSNSSFKSTDAITPIDLEFMEQFQEIKAIYSKTRKKQLRYYRAWCEWNYLRINQVGEALILQLDQIHDHDPRILELALIFQRAIQVINQEITNQNVQPQMAPQMQPPPSERDGDFLIAKKIGVPHQKERKEDYIHLQPQKQLVKLQDTPDQQQPIHNFQIQIDAQGNMYLKKIVRLPIFGTKIQPQPAQRKQLLKLQYLYRKKQEIRQISNLYKRMENMKVRLQHNPKNDPYTFKEQLKMAERNQFYQKEEQNKIKNQYSNQPIDKIIHGKVHPQINQNPSLQQNDYRTNFKPQLMEQKQSIRKNQHYIHRVMAPSFVTDQQANVNYSKNQGSVYGVGPYAEKRDLKIGLPRLKFLDRKVPPMSSYHLVGKLTRDRGAINQRVKSFSAADHQLTRLQKQKQEYKHVWTRYLNEQQMNELTDYNKFYQKLQQLKSKFSHQFQSQYRLNLKKILLYDNKRYEMGGIINKEDEERFYERIRRLIKRDDRKQKKKKRRTKLRQYRRNVGKKEKRKLFQDIFISYHRTVIKDIKEERKNYSIAK